MGAVTGVPTPEKDFFYKLKSPALQGIFASIDKNYLVWYNGKYNTIRSYHHEFL